MLSVVLLLCLYLSCLFAQDEDIRKGDAAFISLKYDEAIKFYTNAIVADSGNVRAYYKRATVHQQRRAYREAMSDLNEVIQLDPEYHLVRHCFLHCLSIYLLGSRRERQIKQRSWEI